jgi:hypothetical protein
MLDLDKIMQSIREEIAAEDALAAGANPKPAANQKHASKIDEMLKMTDADFVKSAYREFLGREADPGALSNLTEELKFGLSDRLSVLRGLQQSDEGRRFGARLVLPADTGQSWQERLDPRLLLQRLVGIRWLVKLGKQLKAADRGPLKLATLPNHVQDLKMRMGAVEFSLADMQKLAAQHQALMTRIAKLEARVRDIGDGSHAAPGKDTRPHAPGVVVALAGVTEASERV